MMECRAWNERRKIESVAEIEKDEINSYLLYGNDSIDTLMQLGESFVFPKNHVFIEAGQYTKYCYVVINGKVASFEDFRDGEERIYHIHEKNSLFLETNLLFDKPTPVGFRTMDKTEVLRLKKRELLKAAKEDASLAFALFEAASDKFFSAMKQVCLVKKYNINWKISDLFLSFADYYGVPYGDKVLIQEKFSQQMVADMLGINRITAVRAIKQLKDLGCLKQTQGRCYVVDVENLRMYRDSQGE